MTLGYIPNWERMSTSTGYPVVYCPDHPRAWSTGYVYAHTVVAEQKLGRLLRKGEVIHHLNENRMDYRSENIEITNQSKHAHNHMSGNPVNLVDLKCPECAKVFCKRRGDTHLIKGGQYSACSRSCNGKFSRKIQLEGLTGYLSQRIAENVIKEYKAPIAQLNRAPRS